MTGKSPIRRIILISCLCIAVCSEKSKSDTAFKDEELKFFESKIRPVLVEQCYRCHSSEEKIRGGLSIDSREGIRHGGAVSYTHLTLTTILLV